jgi:nucleotide-binding universal stress UspA family protein
MGVTQEATMIEKVLVGTDGSATAQRAVERALAVAAGHQAALTVLAVGPDGDRIAQDAVDRHAGSGVDVRALGATGDPARVLVAEAERGGYDLLVTGNKGLTGLRRLAPMDKVPAKVAHHLPCHLLVVKTT